MKAYVGSRDLSPLILNLDSRCRQAGNSGTGRWFGPSVILDILEKTKFSCACREILVEKRATKVFYVFDTSLGCHTFRPFHLAWFEHPKNVRWRVYIFNVPHKTVTLQKTCFNYQLNAQFIYSIIIYIKHYNSRHVSSNTMFIFRRSNCIVTASGIVTLRKQLFSAPVESGLHCIAAYGEWRYQMQEQYNLTSWRWAWYCSKHVEDYYVIYIYI
jgi:hypothetical protein